MSRESGTSPREIGLSPPGADEPKTQNIHRSEGCVVQCISAHRARPMSNGIISQRNKIKLMRIRLGKDISKGTGFNPNGVCNKR